MRKYLLSLAVMLVALFAGIQVVGAQSGSNPLNEDFNGISSGIPANWDNSEGTTTYSDNRWNFYSTGYSGSCVRFNSFSNGTGNTNMLKTPSLDLSAGDWILKFKYKNPAGGDFSVYLSTDGGTTYTTPIATGLVGQTEWVEKEYPITRADINGSSTVKIVFVGTSNYGSGDAYIYLDDVSVEKASDCMSVTGLSVNQLSTTSATITWGYSTTGQFIPSQFYYMLKDASGAQIATADDYTTLDNSISFSTLSPNTTYILEVQGDCIEDGAGLSKLASITFTTLKAAQNPPYQENFDALTALPEGSYSIGDVSVTSSQKFGTSGKSLKMTTTANDPAIFIMPMLNLAANNAEIEFQIKGPSSYAVNYQIGYYISPVGDFTPIANGSTGKISSWREITMNSSSLAETTSPVMFAIMIESGNATDVYIDNIDIHAIPTCIRPEDIAISNVTYNSAVVSWTTANATNYEVRIHNADNSTWTTYNNVTGSPFTMTNLTERTNYDSVTVQAVCGSDSSRIKVYNSLFKTLCSISTDPIFTESFEGLSSNAVPECWTQGWIVKTAGNTKTAPFTSSTTYKHTGSASISMPYEDVGNRTFLSSNQLNIDSAGKYMLSVWVYRQDASDYPDERFNFWITPNLGDTVGGTKLGTVNIHIGSAPIVSRTGWYEYEYLINTSGALYVMVEGVCKWGNVRYIDDIQVKMAPTCIKVSNATISNVTSSSADITWNAGGSETDWIVKYTVKQGATVVTTDSTLVSGQPKFTITGLQPASTYTVTASVTAYCGSQDLAETVDLGSRSITTSCTAISEFPYFEGAEQTSGSSLPTCWSATSVIGSADKVFKTGTTAHSGNRGFQLPDQSEGNINYLTSSQFDIDAPNKYEVSVWVQRAAGGGSYAYPDEGIALWISKNPTDTANATKLAFINRVVTYSPVEASAGWYQYTYAIPDTGLVYLLIEGISQYGGSTYFDDITIREIPTCPDIVGGVTFDEIKDTHITFTLGDQTATAFQYAYGPAGTAVQSCTVVDATGLTNTISNLTAQTEYVLYVRRDCGNDDLGAWSAAFSFTTACGAVTIPASGWIEDFESYSTGLLAGCWNVTNGSYYLNVMSGSTYNNTNGGNKGLCSGYSSTSSSSSSASNDFNAVTLMHLEAGKNYEISAYAKKYSSEYSSSDYTWKLSFVYGASASNMTTAGTHTVSGTTFSRYSSYLSVDADGDYYVGFHTSKGNYTYYYPYIDDVMVREMACIPPTGTFITALSSDSATVNITSTASEWEVAVSSTPIDIAGLVSCDIYHDTINTPSFTVNNLDINTEYYYTVRSICSGTPSDWMQASSFRTSCAAYATPISEGFEAAGDELCWHTNDKIQRSTSQHHTGSASLMSQRKLVISPELDIDSLAKYMFEGWVMVQDKDSAQVSIGVLVDPSDEASFEPISTVTVAKKNTWTPMSCTFSKLNEDKYEDFRDAKYIAIYYMDSTAYYDDILIDIIPSCPNPNEVIVSNVGAHSFDIAFTDNAGASSWVVKTNGIEHVINTNPATVSGLNASTQYIVEIAAICSQTDTSRYTSVGTVKTTCDVVNPPFLEDFSSVETSALPDCWDNSESTSYPLNAVWTVCSINGNKMIRMNDYSANKGTAVVTTPVIALSAGGNYVFEFDFNGSASSVNDPYVLISSNYGTTWDTLFKVLPVSTAYGGGSDPQPQSSLAHYSYDLASYVGNNVMFKFGCTAKYQYGGLFIDNVAVRELLTCSDPNAPVISNISGSSADVTITDTCAAHAQWQYVAGVKGFDPSTVTPVTIDTNNFSVTGLNAETEYTVYVRAYCGAGDSSNWVGSTFKTLCAPFVISVANPFVEDFESYGYEDRLTSSCYDFSPVTSSYYHCTYPSVSNVTSTSYAYYYSHDGNLAGKCLRAYLSKSYVPNGFFMQRQFHLEAGSSYEISAWMFTASYAADYSVKYGLTDDPAEMATAISENIPASSVSSTYDSSTGKYIYHYDEAYRQVKTIISVDSTADYFIRLGAMYGGTNSTMYFYIDDITIRQFDGCAPSAVSVDSITTTSVCVDITDADPTHTFEYVLNDTTATPVAVDTNHFTISNISSSTNYTLYARTVCSPGSYSEWNTASFTTACGTISGFPYSQDFDGMQSGSVPTCWSNAASTSTTLVSDPDRIWGVYNYGTNKMLRMYNYLVSSGTAVIESPLFSLPAEPVELQFDYSHRASCGAFSLRISTDNGVNYTTLSSYYADTQGYDKDNPGTFTHAIVDLTEYAGQNVKLQLYSMANIGSGSIFFDNLLISYIPPCREPQDGPTITGSTMATVSATAKISGKDALVFGIAPFATGVTTADIVDTVLSTDGNATFTNLSAGTNYIVWYKYRCDSVTYSDWSKLYSTIYTKTDDCFTPEMLRIIGQPSDTAVTIAWGGAPDVSQYQCVFATTAGNDTVLVDTTQIVYTGLSPLTSYRFTVRGFCGLTDTTAWSSSISFKTISHPAVVPYSTGFEATDDNDQWEIIASAEDNNFVIGSSTYNTGSQSLYISSDGSTYSQVIPAGYYYSAYNITYITRTLYFPAAGNYSVSFDWKCDPMSDYAYYYTAYGFAFLAPVTTSLTADDEDAFLKYPQGAVPMGTQTLSDNPSWQRHSTIVTVEEPMYANLVFQWAAENEYGEAYDDEATDMPFAVDNVSVQEVNCLPVQSLSVVNMTENSATVAVTKSDSVDIHYGLALINNSDSIIDVDTLGSTNLKDTLTFTELSAATTYYVFVRQACDEGSVSDWTSVKVTTTSTPASIPFVCDFENAADNAMWQFTDASNNNAFMIGNAVSNGGTKSLYVSDNGSSYHYDGDDYTYAYAYRLINMPAGTYNYSFDWKCEGETSTWDWGRLFLAPVSVPVTPGAAMPNLSQTTSPAGAIALDNNAGINGTTDYVTVSGSFDLQTGAYYNLIAYFRTDGSGTGDNAEPLTIDNFSLTLASCFVPVVAVVDSSITENSASVVVTNRSEGSSIVVAASATGAFEDAIFIDTIPYSATPDTVVLSGLGGSSNYHAIARSICGEGDESNIADVTFTTLCGTALLPYTQGFESVPGSYSGPGMIETICWNDINAAPTSGGSSTYPKYHCTASYKTEGTRSLQVYSNKDVALYLVLPEFANAENCRVSFDCGYESQTSSGFFVVGYLTNPASASSFVPVYTAGRGAAVKTLYPYEAVVSGIPAGARIAFEYGNATSNNYYGYLDNIKVSSLVTGDTYNDTVCYGSSYIAHGFNKSASDLHVGLNTFTRLQPASVAGTPDTVITANVTMLPEINVVAYDTVCSGASYPFNGRSYDIYASRTFTATIRGGSARGCDSSVTVYVTVLPSMHHVYDTICQGDAYTFDGQQLTVGGDYNMIGQNKFGCPDTTTLHLLVVDSSTTVIATICEGQSYPFEGQTYTQTGIYPIPSIGLHGCPVTKILDLRVTSTNMTIDTTFCKGGSVTVADTTITTPGTYHRSILDEGTGCMTHYTINVTENPVITGNVIDHACENHLYTGNKLVDVVITKDTTYMINERTADGKCDSVTNVTIKYVKSVKAPVEEKEIPAGDSYDWHDQTYKKSGWYYDTLEYAAFNGCDSICTLKLTVGGEDPGDGVEDVQLLNISLIPNPVNAGQTSFIYGDFENVKSVEVLNSFGQVIDAFVPQTYPIEVQGINASGIYYVRVVTEDEKVAVQKLIVK